MQETTETEHSYPAMDMTQAQRSIRELYDQVARQGKRVEITQPDCDDCCVLISKSELNGLEQAVEILASTDAFEQMSRDIQQLLETAGVVYHAEHL